MDRLFKMDKEDRNFKEKLKLGSDALFWNRLANDSYFQFRNQLIILATILLPLTASVVAIPKANLEIQLIDKILLILGWICLGASIVFGLIQHWIDTVFFVELSADSSLREHIRKNLKVNIDIVDRVIDLLPTTKSKSAHWALIFQVLFLFGGILVIMSSAVVILLRK